MPAVYIKATGHLFRVSCLLHDWLPHSLSLGLSEESTAGLYVLWLVYLFRRCIPLVLERQWDPIVLLSSPSLHLSVRLKRPINNGAPLPTACHPTPVLLKWGRKRKRKHTGIHETHNVSLSLCQDRWTACLSIVSRCLEGCADLWSFSILTCPL